MGLSKQESCDNSHLCFFVQVFTNFLCFASNLKLCHLYGGVTSFPLLSSKLLVLKWEIRDLLRSFYNNGKLEHSIFTHPGMDFLSKPCLTSVLYWKWPHESNLLLCDYGWILTAILLNTHLQMAPKYTLLLQALEPFLMQFCQSCL